jgi:3-oxoacyl-[acyl-carrier protein] reductase
VTEKRVALVTGGAKGIGRAIAQRLANDGMRVCVADVDSAGAAVTARDLHEESFSVEMNVSDVVSVQAAVEQVLASAGHIDVLVNNAGIGQRYALVPDTSPDEWEEVMRVNLRGPFLVCRAVLPTMMTRRFGRIINIASTSAIRPGSHVAAYNVSKYGVVGLTRTLAYEMGKYGITVNAVCPSMADTDLGHRSLSERAKLLGISADEFEQRWLSNVAIGRLTSPEDVANAVAFFADERAAIVTGEVLAVSGGI